PPRPALRPHPGGPAPRATAAAPARGPPPPLPHRLRTGHPLPEQPTLHGGLPLAQGRPEGGGPAARPPPRTARAHGRAGLAPPAHRPAPPLARRTAHPRPRRQERPAVRSPPRRRQPVAGRRPRPRPARRSCRLRRPGHRPPRPAVLPRPVGTRRTRLSRREDGTRRASAGPAFPGQNRWPAEGSLWQGPRRDRP